MEQNKVRTYIFYALGEIFLVVIGILIALQVNNWNEARLKRTVSDQTLQNLQTELQEASLYLKEGLSIGRRITEDAEKYSYGLLTADSIRSDPKRVFKWTDYPTANLDLPILQQETGSERLIIDSNDLNDQLREIKFRMSKVENNRFYLDEFWNREVAPYFVESNSSLEYDRYTRQIPVSPESSVKIFNDDRFRNLVTLNSLLTRDYLAAIELLADSIDEALELIN